MPWNVPCMTALHIVYAAYVWYYSTNSRVPLFPPTLESVWFPSQCVMYAHILMCNESHIRTLHLCSLQSSYSHNVYIYIFTVQYITCWYWCCFLWCCYHLLLHLIIRVKIAPSTFCLKHELVSEQSTVYFSWLVHLTNKLD